MDTIFRDFPEISSPVSFMVRHAERHPIERMINALEVQLTEKGKSDSYKLGESLARYCPINIYHSPVPRCKQTADNIFNGILSVDPRATMSGYMLDLGGPYITGDWGAISTTIEKFGHTQFIRKWFNDELPASLIMSLPDAASVQLKLLVNQLISNRISCINVTHDWNVMIMREYYFNLKHEDIGDPDFLDGLAAYRSGKTLILTYHQNVRVIDIAEYINSEV